MLEVLVQRGMKFRVPVPVTLVAGGGVLEAALEAAFKVEDAFTSEAGLSAEEADAASTKAEAGSPPTVSASPAFNA